MFGFNINRPTDLQSIEGALSSYTTPEAAVADFDTNAPRGRDYLKDQYQRLTGDYFADPFADFAKSHSDDMVQAAMNGASVATGSNAGMRMLSRPMAPPMLPPPTAPTVQPFSSLSPLIAPPSTASRAPSSNLSALGNKEVTNSLITQMLQARGREYQLAGTDAQIPASDSPFSPLPMDVIKRRASLAGVSNEFGRINPRSFTSPIDESDPRFSRTQAGKAIGMDIHPLAYDDDFQEIARRDPEKANALYHAVTNRNYDTDVKAKSQLLVEQRDARKKIIEGVKHLEADPVTGELFKQVEHYDSFGGTKYERVQLTPLEKAAVEAEGGDSIKRIYGIELPNRGGLPKLPGMDDQEAVKYRSRTQQLMKEKGLDVKAASDLAHRQLYAEQESGKTSPAAPQRHPLRRALEAISDVGIASTNMVPRLLNELLMGGLHTDLGTNSMTPIPLIPHPNWDQVADNDVSASDFLRESWNNFNGRPAGRTYGNVPILPPPRR